MGRKAINIGELLKESVASPPHVYLKIKQIMDLPDYSFSDLAEIINYDPSLVVRILKIVNSPLYGFEDKVENVGHAINLMGVEELNQLILATSVMKDFKDFPKRLVDMKSFWRHSIACGVTGKYLAEYHGVPNPGSFYLLGMLHDIGSLVLYSKLPEVSREILVRCKEEKENLFDLELELLGMSHARVGAYLLKEWGLPKKIYEPVAFHHQPLKSDEFARETAILHLADCIVDELGLGNSGEFVPNPINPKVLKRFKYLESPAGGMEEIIRDKFFSALTTFV
ncbi:MAG: HDOD domain-containing protein [Nitrospinae bacterium]|nr:HDOD domain-containing protein [Nitrospinota bacterium]MBL7020042.1 HDOD domain-containing protein [Nitrospinaceae bacterium]